MTLSTVRRCAAGHVTPIPWDQRHRFPVCPFGAGTADLCAREWVPAVSVPQPEQGKRGPF